MGNVKGYGRRLIYFKAGFIEVVMKILVLHKRGLSCACGCGHAHERLDLVNKMNGKYYKLYCGKIYRLHVESIKWIKRNFLGN